MRKRIVSQRTESKLKRNELPTRGINLRFSSEVLSDSDIQCHIGSENVGSRIRSPPIGSSGIPCVREFPIGGPLFFPRTTATDTS
eukprot:251189-Prorocentrum_minimum.AAC.4